jgi:hypothetical protein
MDTQQAITCDSDQNSVSQLSFDPARLSRAKIVECGRMYQFFVDFIAVLEENCHMTSAEGFYSFFMVY